MISKAGSMFHSRPASGTQTAPCQSAIVTVPYGSLILGTSPCLSTLLRSIGQL